MIKSHQPIGFRIFGDSSTSETPPSPSCEDDDGQKGRLHRCRAQAGNEVTRCEARLRTTWELIDQIFEMY